MFKISLKRQTGWILGIFSATLSRLSKINSRAEKEKTKISETIADLRGEYDNLSAMQESNSKVIANLENLLGK